MRSKRTFYYVGHGVGEVETRMMFFSLKQRVEYMTYEIPEDHYVEIAEADRVVSKDEAFLIVMKGEPLPEMVFEVLRKGRVN